MVTLRPVLHCTLSFFVVNSTIFFGARDVQVPHLVKTALNNPTLTN